MTRLSTSLSITCLFLIGCGDIVPTEGAWISSDLTYTTNGCNLEALEGDTSVNIMVGADNTFTLDLGDESTLNCTLEGDLFDCDTLAVTIPMEEEAAELSITYNSSGTFNASDSMNTTLSADYDCSGDGCEAVSAVFEIDFPCSNEAAGLFLAQN
jgi:hypothetical protein